MRTCDDRYDSESDSDKHSRVIDLKNMTYTVGDAPILPLTCWPLLVVSKYHKTSHLFAPFSKYSEVFRAL